MKLKKNLSNYWLKGRLSKKEELNLRSSNIRNCVDVIPVVKEFDNIIKYKNNGILNFLCNEGVLFKKIKESDRFKEMLRDIGISKSIIYFRLNLIKVLKSTHNSKIFVVVKFYKEFYEIH